MGRSVLGMSRRSGKMYYLLKKTYTFHGNIQKYRQDFKQKKELYIGYQLSKYNLPGGNIPEMYVPFFEKYFTKKMVPFARNLIREASYVSKMYAVKENEEPFHTIFNSDNGMYFYIFNYSCLHN